MFTTTGNLHAPFAAIDWTGGGNMAADRGNVAAAAES